MKVGRAKGRETRTINQHKTRQAETSDGRTHARDYGRAVYLRVTGGNYLTRPSPRNA